jgi:hypothetical protein
MEWNGSKGLVEREGPVSFLLNCLSFLLVLLLFGGGRPWWTERVTMLLFLP